MAGRGIKDFGPTPASAGRWLRTKSGQDPVRHADFPKSSFLVAGDGETMPRHEVVVLIPESTRKRSGGDPTRKEEDSIMATLPAGLRDRLLDLRKQLLSRTGGKGVDAVGLMPAYERFDGNMYRRIEPSAWAGRTAGVEVLIVSALRGLLGSRDTVPRYSHSMAEAMPPLGKLNAWWRERGLPDVLRGFLAAVRPRSVVDLLSLEYRDAVEGYREGLEGVSVRAIDFPGMGRASQPERGRLVSKILRSGGP